MKALAAEMFVEYYAGGYTLSSWSLSDIHTLPPIPGTVRIPGEDALPTALIISAVSDWDFHQFRERGNIKLTLWRKDEKAGDGKEVPQIQLVGYYFQPASSLSDRDLNTIDLAFLHTPLKGFFSLPRSTYLSQDMPGFGKCQKLWKPQLFEDPLRESCM